MLRFDEFMERALYEQETGFFATSGQAGAARGDFITSPEVGPLFGVLVAEYLDRCWERAGCPPTFTVVEFAAGRGALAISVRAAAPRCAAALRYHLVEVSPSLRARQAEHLPVDHGGGAGLHFFSHAGAETLPQQADLVFANELLDNIPFRLFERSGERDSGTRGEETEVARAEWREVWVNPDDGRETLERVDRTLAERLDRLAPEASPGTRIPLQERAGEWLRRALDLVGPDGTVTVVDYARTTAEMAALHQNEWVRTYRGHSRGGAPTEAPGTQDITVDVAIDQLEAVGGPSANQSQSEWLAELGIAGLVDEGRRVWQASAAAPDLFAIRARSRVAEAEALTDPSGLGGFRVLSWGGSLE